MTDPDGLPRGRVLHLALRERWHQALREGAYRGSTRGRTLEQVDYVHASTSEQVPLVIEAVFAGASSDDHVVLVVDVEQCDRVGSTVRWEAPGVGEQLFPHIYGPIPLSAVVATFPVERAADGSPALPDLSGLDVITSPAAS